MKKTGLIAGVIMLALTGCGQGTPAASAPAAGVAAESTTEAAGTEESAEQTEAEETSGEDSAKKETTAGETTAAESPAPEAAAESESGSAAESKAVDADIVKAAESTAAPAVHSGFVFAVNGVLIGMNEEAAPIVEKLGTAANYFESPSCAFQGIDKTYTYSNFELYTYPKNKVDYVSSIYVLDGSISTQEGIHIGSTTEEMTAAYGNDYKEELGAYTYTKDKSTLTFIVDNGTVSSIEYVAIVKKEK